MTTFKLTSSVDANNTVVGDLHLQDGQLVLLSGNEAIKQNIKTRLRMFLGEWFLDQREGVPYFEEVLLKSPDFEVLRSIFRQAIGDTPGVVSVDELDLEINGETRELSVTFVASVDGGEQIEVGSGSPFIIEV